MPAGIETSNTDHTAEEIRALARECKNRAEARRLRAFARVMEGVESRAGIARRAKVDRQTLCDWVNRYNAMGLSWLTDKLVRGCCFSDCFGVDFPRYFIRPGTILPVLR